MKYYRLLDDVGFEGRWFLGTVEGIQNFWDFHNYNKVTHENPLTVKISEHGQPLDFTFAAFDIFIVNDKVKKLFDKDVVFYPITVSDLIADKYYVMQIENEVECIDEKSSVFDKWEEGNTIRPDKAGQYKTLYKLKIDKSKEYKNQIFRIKDYSIGVIVSQTLMETLERNKIRGIKFKEV